VSPSRCEKRRASRGQADDTAGSENYFGYGLGGRGRPGEIGQAIENRRQLQKTIAQMERLSRQVLFKTLPDTRTVRELKRWDFQAASR